MGGEIIDFIRIGFLERFDERKLVEEIPLEEMAARCADAGAEVAALTPQRLAEWVGTVLK